MKLAWLLVLFLAACAPPRGELWIGGDVHFGEKPIRGRLAAISALFPGAIGVVNLEGPVGSNAPPRRLVNTPASLEELVRARVRVAAVANNHRRDLAEEGERATLRTLADRGIFAAAEEPVFIEVGGARVAITAHDLAGDFSLVPVKADLWIATFHVTGPALYLPPPELKNAVEIALAAGAQIVVAHGSHVIGPVERRGDRAIVWGLGNLVFDCDCTLEREGLVLHLKIEDRLVVEASVVAIDVGLGGEPARAAADPKATLDLLQAIGSTSLKRNGVRASF